FLLVTANLERLGAEWSSSAEMSVYVKDDITEAERRMVEGLLTPNDVLAGREYVSKADAMTRFRQTFADLASAIDTLGDNPLPASYEVRLRGDAADRPQVEELAARLRQTPGVADVRYDRQWLVRVLSAIDIIRTVGFVLGALLTAAAALTVANVVR